jgi:aconitate hydratase
MLVVAYALAGTVEIDLVNEPLGIDSSGEPVYLRDIWPTQREIDETISACIGREDFIEQYADVFEGSEDWRSVEVSRGVRYAWDEQSTYIQSPPFFDGLRPEPAPIEAISGARVLCMLGDSVTTDHISPAGAIGANSPAGKYLIDRGVPVSMFNSFGSRRGNDRVMTRGTFGNIRVRNKLAPDTEGGFTVDFTQSPTHAGSQRSEGPGSPTGIAGHPITTIYEASLNYHAAGISLIVLAGKDYGMGSSRDWAAKGTFLLGVRAVIAESFERIHRSNLVGMGVLPLTFKNGQTAQSLGLDGTETYDIELGDDLQPRQDVRVQATKADGTIVAFATTCRIDTPVEVEYYRNGGILHTVLRKMARV